MRKQKNFTEEQKCKLLKSPFVEKVYSNHIVYSIEFKQIAISKYKQGVIPVKIFIDADLDLELIGKKNAFNLIRKSRSGRTCEPIKNRDDKIRTCDPRVPNTVRYQTALHPDDNILLLSMFYMIFVLLNNKSTINFPIVLHI